MTVSGWDSDQGQAMDVGLGFPKNRFAAAAGDHIELQQVGVVVGHRFDPPCDAVV
ncbi:MAG: hypothetical protein AAGJ38_00185 [Planctomycetota bacterium]